MPRPFAEIVDDLRSDGGLRDFYIHNTNRSDWNALLRHLRSRLHEGCFQVDGLPRQLPETFEAIEEIWLHACPCVSIPVAGSYVNCHFFCDHEIELDFRPEDFRTPELWSALLGFLQELVDVIGKPGVITYENHPSEIIERLERGRRPRAALNESTGR